MWNLEGLSKDNVDESENVILLEDVTSRFCNDFYSKSFSELNTKQLSWNENNCDKHKNAKGKSMQNYWLKGYPFVRAN